MTAVLPVHEELHEAVPDIRDPGGFSSDAKCLEDGVVLVLGE